MKTVSVKMYKKAFLSYFTGIGLFKKRTAVEEGTTTADSLSFKGGMRNYVYSSTASQQYLIYYKACAIMRAPFFLKESR